MKKLLIYIVIAVNFHCAFGSIGDGREQRQQQLLLWLELVRSVPGSVNILLNSFDDQGDRNLRTFTIAQGAALYEVEFSEGSLVVDKTEISILQGLLRTDNPRYHTSGGSVSGGAVFQSAGAEVADFLSANADVATGPASQKRIGSISKIPHAEIRSVNLHISSLKLAGVVAMSGRKQNFRLESGVLDIAVAMSCRPYINALGELNLEIAFRYSDLLKAGTGAGILPSILDANAPLVLSATQNTLLFNDIVANLKNSFSIQECQ